ncbi:MAG: hypothetical protein K2I73_00730 [Eubacterium sp.]|nr:hypothetical protein [Eubacterium sp.]
MTEKFVLREHFIPDGILHDQDLYEVKLENNVLTLSFEVHCFSDHSASFVEKYKDFTKCHIKCKLSDEQYCESEVELRTCINKKKQYITQIVPIEEFVDLANKEILRRRKKDFYPGEYIGTGVGANFGMVHIELFFDLKYKRKEYDGCTLNLHTEEIEFIWE